MKNNAVHPDRVRRLTRLAARAGDYVLYWMQQSARAEWNDALEFSLAEANARGLPLLVVFGLIDAYPEANVRHYFFLLEGLRETRETLARRGIRMVIQRGEPADVALRLGRRAALIVCDRGYLRHQKAWRRQVAEGAGCAVFQVEADVVVPVERASNRAEYAARTIRPKLERQFAEFLVEPARERVGAARWDEEMPDLDLQDIAAFCRKLPLDQSVAPVSGLFRGGTAEAKKVFEAFLEERMDDYAENRNQPQTDDVSHMSKYLHFGQVSPVWLAVEARKRGAASENVATFVEELIVRRELAMNFAEFTPGYDTFAILPGWARDTLERHARDPRPHVYTRAQLEAGETHDPYWNAAMREMRATGYMHNYMRMYWGKKILEWGRTPEEAHANALAMNNKFFLDGRDANSFANVGWVFGLHDRPWGERPIYGTVRCMMASGLERKCDIQAYVEKTERLEAGENQDLFRLR
jgi:deoxyribodipyrimidine photo-lyase